MKKKIILRSIVIILIILNVFVMYLISKPNDNNKVLEDIKVVDLKNNKSIAIMVQDTNTEEWHEADNRDSWPSPSTHGFVGAECTDSDGATLEWEKVLTFSLANQTATIKTKQTAYCTLYFAKGEPALDWLKQKGGTTFAGSAHTTVTDGMYRFKGTSTQVLNNYICFGTTIEKICTDTPATYIYRIIGITSENDDTVNIPANSLKIIKAVPSSTSQQWYSSVSNITWDYSAIKTYLNTTFYNATFVTEATKIPDASYWDSIILSHSWYNEDQVNSLPNVEKKTSHTDASKIGLMYGTDYINSGDKNANNWLFIKNGWAGNSSIIEWTMTRYGESGSNGNWCAWGVSTSGFPTEYNLNYARAVRPVFYLQSGVNLTGEGTKEHPYIITTMNNA